MKNTLNKLKIANFFGGDAQIRKADEELDEICDAFGIYSKNPTTENLTNLINEANDLLNVLEGLAMQKGVSIEEMQAEKEYKVYRTMSIINKIPRDAKDKVTEYERLRKEVI